MAVYDDWDGVRRVRRRPSPPAPARSSRPSCAARCPGPARCSPSASTTAATPRSPAWPCPRSRPPSPSSRAASPGPFDDIEIVGGADRLGGRARRRHRPHRRPRRRGRRLGARRRRSPSARTSATGTCSSPPARSSPSASPAAATARSGPWVVTPDELADPDDLALGCSVDGETVQDARTSDLDLRRPPARRRAVRGAAPAARRHHLHRHARRRRRRPQAAALPRSPATRLETWIEGIGTIRNHIVEGR